MNPKAENDQYVCEKDYWDVMNRADFYEDKEELNVSWISISTVKIKGWVFLNNRCLLGTKYSKQGNIVLILQNIEKGNIYSDFKDLDQEIRNMHVKYY